MGFSFITGPRSILVGENISTSLAFSIIRYNFAFALCSSAVAFLLSCSAAPAIAFYVIGDDVERLLFLYFSKSSIS
jgi:hypothetical protein